MKAGKKLMRTDIFKRLGLVYAKSKKSQKLKRPIGRPRGSAKASSISAAHFCEDVDRTSNGADGEQSTEPPQELCNGKEQQLEGYNQLPSGTAQLGPPSPIARSRQQSQIAVPEEGFPWLQQPATEEGLCIWTTLHTCMPMVLCCEPA